MRSGIRVTSIPSMPPSHPKASARLTALWRLRGYLLPYRWQLLVMVLAGLAATLAGLSVPVLSRILINGPVARQDSGQLWWIGVLALVFGVAEGGLIFLRRWTVSNAALGLETDLRNDLYEKLQRLPVEFHDQWKSGQLVSRMTSDISAVRRFVGFGAVFLVVNTITCVLIGVLLIVIDPLLGTVVVLCGVPTAYLTTRLEHRYHREIRAVQDQQGEVANDVEESALGIRAIKAFGRQRVIGDRFDAKADDLRVLQVRQIHTLADLWALLMAQPTLVLSLIALFGAVAVHDGALTLGTLVGFVAMYQLMVWPVQSMGWLLATAQEASSAVARIYEVLDAPVTLLDPTEEAGGADPDAATPPAVASGGTRHAARVVFDHVVFGYPNATTPVLRDIDLVLEPGETLALVGPTGCGKTTLTALLPRLYDVTGGRLLLDGVDVRDLSLRELRTIVACAFEEPTLFSASVRENVLLGHPDPSTADEELIAEALRVAQAEFVYDLPWGLDTRVGEQGLSLSGGQRQRLALARAVIGRPAVLVLDDPLSALDVHTEHLVEQALRRVLADTTALVVAHRPSTVLLADRVALLDGGRIAAVGTHHELLATVPAYRDILSQDSDLRGRDPEREQPLDDGRAGTGARR
jgi:ATP-binding cassette subfamily B protein